MNAQRPIEQQDNFWSKLRQDMLRHGWSEKYIDGLFDVIRSYLLTVPDNG